MYEIELLSKLAAYRRPQQRNNDSSILPRRCWISRMRHPTLFHLSNRVWEASTPSSNTTKSVSIQSPMILLTCPPPGMQRRRREPRRPCPMAREVEGRYGDNKLRRESSGGGETRATHKVPITSLSSYRLKPIIIDRSLEDIEKRSRRLLDKGKGARILDKRRDSGAIVKLVEELRQAILLYQVRTVENCRLSRVDALWTAIATAFYKQSGHTIDRKCPSNVLTIRPNRRPAQPSRLSTHF